MTHTPTPEIWGLNVLKRPQRLEGILDFEIDFGEDQVWTKTRERAESIVRALSAHSKLVEALEGIQGLAHRLRGESAEDATWWAGVDITAKEALLAARPEQEEVKTEDAVCPQCGGDGAHPGLGYLGLMTPGAGSTCKNCKGTGKVQEVSP